MQVRVYWNLHRNVWSVQDAKTRRVIGHANRVLLRSGSFKVSEAGRQRVLREGRKNVHAFACGQLEAATWAEHGWGKPMNWTKGDDAYLRAAVRLGKRVTYNPRKFASFVDSYDESPIHAAEMIALDRRTVLAFDPCDMTDAESAAATF